MPILDDPNAFAFYTLRSDRNKTNPIRFKVRCFTRAQGREIRREIDAANTIADEEQGLDHVLEKVITPNVLGWINTDAPFNLAQLNLTLRAVEIWELAYNLGAAVLMSEEDAKKSASPASSGQASSASPVVLVA